MEGSLEAPPPTPATPSATVDPSPHRSPDPSSDAAAGASVPPTTQHPARLFATPSDYFATFGPVATFGFLLADPIVPPAFSFDLSKGFRRSGPRCLVRVDRHAHTAPRSLRITGPATCVLHAYSALTCLSLFWERTGLLYLYLEGLSLFGGPYEYIWRALLCLEGLMSMRVFACGGPVPLPLSPLPGCA